jgi:hypothetical protein
MVTKEGTALILRDKAIGSLQFIKESSRIPPTYYAENPNILLLYIPLIDSVNFLSTWKPAKQ